MSDPEATHDWPALASGPELAVAPVSERAEPLLRAQGLTLAFAGLVALDDVSFAVHDSELFAIIGPNGAGKTSILNCINGVYRPRSGSIAFAGREKEPARPGEALPPGQPSVEKEAAGPGMSGGPARASGASPSGFASPSPGRSSVELVGMRRHEIAALGVARTFQNVELFPRLSVVDNLMLGRHHLMRTGVVAGGLPFGPARREEVRHRQAVERIVDFLELEAIRRQLVATLPFGLQKRVELGRALAMEPRLLLLDEPVSGMNQEETEDMARFVLDIKEELGIAQILVDHDMGVVMELADRVLVLDFGRVIAEGTPAEIQRHPLVIRAYLGEELSA